MLDPSLHTALAAELLQSERSRVQIPQFSLRHPSMTMADSYAIQRAWIALETQAGATFFALYYALFVLAAPRTAVTTEADASPQRG